MHVVQVTHKRGVLVRDNKKKATTMLERVPENEQMQRLEILSPLKGDKCLYESTRVLICSQVWWKTPVIQTLSR